MWTSCTLPSLRNHLVVWNLDCEHGLSLLLQIRWNPRRNVLRIKALHRWVIGRSTSLTSSFQQKSNRHIDPLQNLYTEVYLAVIAELVQSLKVT